ncbi:hypothetical protein LB507_006102 [Fusarium sp. FIESC RH6]|nr:hypothetical protein LB507_006102 [Fusarium sp. FIESC RH6]
MVERPGLLWDESGICTMPLWEHEPKIEGIIKVFLRLGFAHNRHQLHVSVLGQGAINKAYLVKIREAGNEKALVMRVSLPIDPGNKICGEVATVQWLRRYTTLPVPEVINYMASPDDDIGYEWILMSHVPGQTALVEWRKMSMNQKRRLVEQIASYQHELTGQTFDAIGTLRKVEDKYAPGQIVDLEFCFGDHFSYNINRGPFHCARDWFQALADIIAMDFEQVLHEEDLDEFDLTMTKHYLGIVNRLRQLIPTLFSDTTPERTVVWHDDLSLSNMIIDEDGNLNGIIDWECISTIPIWAATDTPSFLRSQDRHDEPRPERYYRRAPKVDIYGRDDEGLDDKYWRDLEDYEFTILRAHYDSCRRHHNPWCKNDLPKDEKLKYDFLDAINLCRAQDLGGAVDEWIDELEEGNIIALEYGDYAFPL